MTKEDGNASQDGGAKRGPGRPKQYEKWSNTERGAPKLVVRVSPDVKEWVETRPEKPRDYIERLVRTDRDQSQDSALPLTGEAEQAAEA